MSSLVLVSIPKVTLLLFISFADDVDVSPILPILTLPSLQKYQSLNNPLDISFLSSFELTEVCTAFDKDESILFENLNFILETEKVINENKEFDIAFICASGARSEIAANYFIEKNYKNIFHIPEGILGKNKDGWLFLGYPIESYIDK